METSNAKLRTSKLSDAKSELHYERCEMNLKTFTFKFASRKFHDMADNIWYLLVICVTFKDEFQ
jgi:hypothetical protein